MPHKLIQSFVEMKVQVAVMIVRSLTVVSCRYL